jgi:hypothetical protein
MAGIQGRSGRKEAPGRVFKFFFYYRYVPGQDPPELEALLEAIVANQGAKRRDILRSALLGGAQQARDTAGRAEDSQATGLLEAMFDEF